MTRIKKPSCEQAMRSRILEIRGIYQSPFPEILKDITPRITRSQAREHHRKMNRILRLLVYHIP